MAEEDRMVRLMMEQLAGQSDFVIQSAAWLVSHLHWAKSVCEHSAPLSDSEFNQEIRIAMERRDHVYYALLICQRVTREQREATPPR